MARASSKHFGPSSMDSTTLPYLVVSHVAENRASRSFTDRMAP